MKKMNAYMVLVACAMTTSSQASVLFEADFDTTKTLADFTTVDLTTAGGNMTVSSVAGVSGNGAKVASANYGDNKQAGGYITPTAVAADAAFDFSLSYDFKFGHESTYDDAVLFLGNLSSGNYYSMYTSEQAGDNDVWIAVNGDRENLTATVNDYQTAKVDDTWYSVTYNWNATTETLSYNMTLQGDATSVESYDVVLDGSSAFNTSFADMASVQIGFGSHNDNATFDNISFEGTTAIPEPATIGLLGAGALGLVVARRRLKK